ncbi:MAG TPA: hypothetical protein VGS59_13290 [Candidatus Acidoferrales bacterium]|nr:hypothetical protein [Candidatus Acidoferrales bacterium]
MRKTITFALIFLVAGLVYAANDVWKTKPYQQWDQNDLKEILTNSPWVKRTTVMASWVKGGAAPAVGGQYPQNQPTEQTQQQTQTQQRPGSMGGGAGSGSGGGGASPAAPEQNAPPMPQGQEAGFFVRWSSALTEREALARSAQLKGQFSEAQIQQYVNQTPTTYDVVVYGPDMTPFASETEETLKSEVYLEVKPSKEKVNPSAIKIAKGNDGKVQTVLFSFPRQGPNGQPLISGNDKQAQFDCKTKQMHLDAQFDLRKMVGKDGQEL